MPLFQGLTNDQRRLLCLIGFHTKNAQNVSIQEKASATRRWLDRNDLDVLIYEGIVANVFGYDYAPFSTQIGNRRVWLNISHDGHSDIAFLREEQLICALRMTDNAFEPGIGYRITEKGEELLQHVSRKEMLVVDRFAFAGGTQDLRKAVWDGFEYWLVAATLGVKQKSSITAIEDVSYVSSAFIPQCLRYNGGRPTMSNAHRAHECSTKSAIDNIRDCSLEEIITLNSVSLVVAEYVPFGVSFMANVNKSLGSTERIQGGYLSAPMPQTNKWCSDCESEAIKSDFSRPEALTSYEVLDYGETNHINMEAEIRYEEDPGVVQVESFGISFHNTGTCFYGMQIEAVMDRVKNKISLDHLSRIIVDVQKDSSTIAASILCAGQTEILDFIYLGESPQRNKFNLVVANEINPRLTATQYMDRGEYENEIQQLVGDTQKAYDISEHDTLIFGSHGLMVCGPYARLHEPLLCAYIQFVTADFFVHNCFSRVKLLKTDLNVTGSLIDAYQSTPGALKRARQNLDILSDDVSLANTIFKHIDHSVPIMRIPPMPPEQAGRSLFDHLDLGLIKNRLVDLVVELKISVEQVSSRLKTIEQKYSNAALEVSISRQETIAASTEEALQKTKKECSKVVHSQVIVQYLICGIIAFDILDRMTGNWTSLETAWMKRFSSFIKSPFIWIFVSTAAWVAVVFIVQKNYRKLNWRYLGSRQVKIRCSSKIRVDRLTQLLSTKQLLQQERHFFNEDNRKEFVRLTYCDPNENPNVWGGEPPLITLYYDFVNQILFDIHIEYNLRQKKTEDFVISESDIKEQLFNEFKKAGIFPPTFTNRDSDNFSLTKERMHQTAMLRRTLETKTCAAQQEDKVIEVINTPAREKKRNPYFGHVPTAIHPKEQALST